MILFFSRRVAQIRHNPSGREGFLTYYGRYLEKVVVEISPWGLFFVRTRGH